MTHLLQLISGYHISPILTCSLLSLSIGVTSIFSKLDMIPSYIFPFVLGSSLSSIIQTLDSNDADFKISPFHYNQLKKAMEQLAYLRNEIYLPILPHLIPTLSPFFSIHASLECPEDLTPILSSISHSCSLSIARGYNRFRVTEGDEEEDSTVGCIDYEGATSLFSELIHAPLSFLSEVVEGGETHILGYTSPLKILTQTFEPMQLFPRSSINHIHIFLFPL